jgi:hypothetical protein
VGTNPLRQVLDAIGTADDIEWKFMTGGSYTIPPTARRLNERQATEENGNKRLNKKAGREARDEFIAFKAKCLEPRGLSEASAYIPPFAVRDGLSVARSLARYLFKLLSIGTKGT